MALPKELTTVTTFSKTLALLLFITLPILAFVLGASYQKAIDDSQSIVLTPTPTPTEEVACTMDAKICPDGASVGRVPPNCEFEACPNEETPSTEYECPPGNYVNCMPGPIKSKNPDCSAAYIQWAESNCPGFEVVY